MNRYFSTSYYTSKIQISMVVISDGKMEQYTVFTPFPSQPVFPEGWKCVQEMKLLEYRDILTQLAEKE